MFWPSGIQLLYFLCIPLVLSAIYTWKKVLKWIILGFASIVVSLLAFYLLKTMYPELIDKGIAILPPEKLILYDSIVAVFCFILITFSMYYYFQFNKIRMMEVIQSNGSCEEDLDLDLEAHSAKEYKKYENIYRQIIEYFEQQELYLNAEFSSAQMAHDLKSNIAYLSKAIQLHSGMNFNNFINSYRINKVKEMLQTNAQQYTLQHIFESCGFRSQSVFNKAFKLQEGITPSEYIKTLKRIVASE
jgi:AraC-like DNA-binding protein